MRTESYWTRMLIDYLNTFCRKNLTYKFADQFTGGIPDVVTIGSGKSTWLELKVLRPKQQMSARIKMPSDRHAKLQLHDMCKIQENDCPAYYVFFLPTPDLRYFIVIPGILHGWVYADNSSEPKFQDLLRGYHNNFQPIFNIVTGEGWYDEVQFR